MAMVDVDNSSLQNTDGLSPSQLAWSEGQQPLCTVLYSSDEPGELLK